MYQLFEDEEFIQTLDGPVLLLYPFSGSHYAGLLVSDLEYVAVGAVSHQIVDLVFLRNFHLFELDQVLGTDALLAIRILAVRQLVPDGGVDRLLVHLADISHIITYTQNYRKITRQSAATWLSHSARLSLVLPPCSPEVTTRGLNLGKDPGYFGIVTCYSKL